MSERVVVSNATPLIALAGLELLAILPKLFGKVLIPQAVYDEIHSNPEAIGVAAFNQAEWLMVQPVEDKLAVTMLLDQLDQGESEAIILAHELHCDLLLMDERRGRRRAMQGGLTVLGTLGILVNAHHKQMIGPLQPLLVRLRQLSFHMGDELIREVLRRAGES
jgi:predicted nucleic acid-binding protein